MNINNIPKLDGHNYRTWRERFLVEVGLGEIDTAIHHPCPVEPVAPVRGADEDESAFATREREYENKVMKYHIDHRIWTVSNHKCLLVATATIEENIRGSISECATIKEYLEKLKSQFTGSTKATASTLIKKLVTARYTGGGIRKHISDMRTTAAKLQPMDHEDF